MSKKFATTKYMMPCSLSQYDSNEADQSVQGFNFFYPCSIVRSFEEIVSVFAQQPREGDSFSFMTDNILFVAELVR